MYIAVELATSGGTPNETISGLNIELPPSPIAPLIHPPLKANESK